MTTGPASDPSPDKVGNRGGRTLRIGLSACFFHADPTRPIFKDRTLLYLEESMAHWVASGGVLTYLIPRPAPDADDLDVMVDDLDGLVLQGGSDVCPRTYGEEPLDPAWEGDAERDTYEIDLLHRFHEEGKPVLGVCRGAQLVNVAFGGTLFQDVGTQMDTEIVHRDWEPYDSNVHRIEIAEGSGLAALYPGVSTATVNSVHHQSVKELGDGLVAEATSAEDAVIEALRLSGDDRYVFGVQWHPEWIQPDDDSLLSPTPILDEFLAAAESARSNREVGG